MHCSVVGPQGCRLEAAAVVASRHAVLQTTRSDVIPRTDTANEMGRACSTFGGEERCIQGFGRETLREGAIWKTQA